MDAHKVDHFINTVATTVGVASGAVSMMNNVEQMGRIILLFISICSGIFLILVNWDKAMAQLKKWIGKS